MTGSIKWFKDISDQIGLKERYRKLALKHHPDRNGGNNELMADINKEYHQLKRVLPQVAEKTDNMILKKDVWTKLSGSANIEEFRIDPLCFVILKQVRQKCPGLNVAIKKGVVMARGDTSLHLKTLIKLGFTWNSYYNVWNYSPPGGVVRQGNVHVKNRNTHD